MFATHRIRRALVIERVNPKGKAERAKCPGLDGHDRRWAADVTSHLFPYALAPLALGGAPADVRAFNIILTKPKDRVAKI